MTDTQQRPRVDPDITVDDFIAEARAWLDENAEKRTDRRGDFVWGEGDFDVAVFHNMTFDEESAYIDGISDWIKKKSERGYHAITGPASVGGLGLSRKHARAYGRLEREYASPGRHELIGVTTGLIAPTIDAMGSDTLKERFVGDLLRTDLYACQLFSEPGAGSDLAGLSCRAERDGDEWVINGQKVWSSGAQFSEWGELIARTDPDEVKHKGLTAFMLPLDAPGVEVRPITQMSGGSSFCEVFFSDVRIPDDLRIGDVGQGWLVAMTTLGFERDHSESGGDGSSSGGNWTKLLATAEYTGAIGDPVVRDRLVQQYIHGRIESLTNRRAADLAKSGTPGPEGSLGKLLWTEGMNSMSDTVSAVLGARLIADTGEWGTYAWGEHLLGAPGYRIAGGSDEVQRNIIGERVLG
ncbi:acyl-CoA dehydrogenase family protein, partial [Ilumatobacter nonamiensis]|uniref:acyl-CoA dehydrogenase family protein n=1 Tax=Ilumatobacter nonamiensis TaxID=467093 RepID=UPI00058E8225